MAKTPGFTEYVDDRDASITATGIVSGITFNSNYWVLTQVIAV